MNRYYYDLHIHSCLSPCAENDMTPCNIAGLAALNGLNIVALTDHNSGKNCPAFYKAAKNYGVIPVAGMELTTAEDIHLVCLFPTLEDAMNFSDEIDKRRIRVKNRKDIFGDQLIMDEEDNVLGEEEDLLPNATTVSLDEAPTLVEKHNGVCYPAHIDREANGIVAILGELPKTPEFSSVEIHDRENTSAYVKDHHLEGKTVVVSSDAHMIEQLREKENYFDLEDEPYSGDLVRRSLFNRLRGVK
ncbi:PHP domain-containing protein [bacterium]|nr:PHP domain-containing protein [bacterium]